MKFTLDPQIPHSCSASHFPQSTVTFNLWENTRLCKNIPHPLRADAGHAQPSWGLCYRPAPPPAPLTPAIPSRGAHQLPGPGRQPNPCSQCSQPSCLASSGPAEQPAPALPHTSGRHYLQPAQVVGLDPAHHQQLGSHCCTQHHTPPRSSPLCQTEPSFNTGAKTPLS